MADKSFADLMSELKQTAPDIADRQSSVTQAKARSKAGMPDQSGFISDVILRTGLGQGLMMGAGDEIEAYFRSTFGDDSYDKALSDVRKKLSVAQAERPTQTMIAEVGGSLLPMVPALIGTGGAAAPAVAARTAGLAERMVAGGLKNTALGSAMGGAEGFLKGEGGFENRADRAAEEATTGGIVGGVLGTAAPAVSAAYRKATATPIERAQTRVTGLLGEQGITPEQAAIEYAARQAQGVKPEILADIMPGSAIAAESRRVLQAPGANRGEITQQLAERGLEQGQRITQAFETATGTNKKFFPVLDELEQARKADAAPLYAAAYGTPARNQTIDNLLLTAPDDVFNEAKRAARYEGLVFPNLIATSKDGARKIVGDYTIKDIDLVKRGLDRIIENNTNEVSGALNSEARRAYLLKNSLIGEADKLSSEYAAARAAWAGPSAVMDAMKKGERIFSEQAEVTARDIARLGQSEKEGFLIGTLKAANQRINRSISDAAAIEDASRAFRSGNAKGQIEAALTATGKKPDEVRSIADALFKDIEREAVMARTRQTVTGGSPTFANLAQDQSFGAGMQAIPGVINDMRQGGFGGGAAGMLQRAATAASTGFTQSGREATNAEIAKILFARNQGDVTQSMEALRQRALMQQQAAKPSYVPGLLSGGVSDLTNR
jgi:VIT1/CCC1 family predicted Fe2+/Mn2+ transporter